MSESKSGLDVKVELTLRDVQKILCPKCKGKLRTLVSEQIKNRMADKLVKQVLD
jgi:uncharacterized protein with PIN domain